MALAAIPRRAALLTRGLKFTALRPSMYRSVATQAASPSSPTSFTSEATGTGKREGTIADAFASLSGQEFKPLEPRFGALKASLIRGHEDAVAASWDRLLGELRNETARVAALGPSAVPSIEFEDIDRPGNQFSDEFRRRGVAVIRGAVPEGEARQMQDDIRSYIALNPHTKAFPADKPSVYELYWSPAQVRARAHPRLLAAQAFALSHWHSADPDAPVSSTPIAYADRLRMRPPGDSVFALGPHVDGGSCERWEPEGYGRGGVYDSVFRGRWEDLDQWEASRRLPVVASLYDGVGACSAFRMCQGWLSISDVGPFEGTLLVNPMLKLSTAYYLLRPFFSPRKSTNETASAEEFLSPDNWQLETSSSSGQFSSWLQGATIGQGQELREVLHPHLDLARTMVHVPRVRPGDYVLWHCDTIHAVDAVHRGAADSSVMYIPACPLTEENAHYLARQRASFLSGAPSPDFGGGAGESAHRGRPGTAEIEAVGGTAALQAMGLAPWDATLAGLGEGEKKVMLRANEILGL